MNLGVAIVVGAALIAATIAVSHRYVVVAHACGATCSRAWLINQWTGRMVMCEYDSTASANNIPGPICYRTLGEYESPSRTEPR